MHNAQALSQHSQDKVEQSTALPDRWIERVLSVMASTYGARFADMWAGVSPDDMKREWARKLGALTQDEIVRGIDALGKFCPTLPEFVELCRPKPDYETAYREAVEQTRLRMEGKDKWSQPAIYWASLHISYFDLMNSSYPQVKQRWIAALDACLNTPNMPTVPEAQVALPPVGGTRTPEVAQENIERMNAMLKSSRFATWKAA
jgi:hypothetical protein